MMAEAVFNLDVRATKVPRLNVSWDRCLCHVTQATGNLTPFTTQSWTKLRESAESRKDGVHDQLTEHWGEGPAGGYHRQCYQAYTNKTLISRLLSKSRPGTSVEQPATPVTGLRMNRSSHTPTPSDTCIICQQVAKRSGSRVEKVSQCLTDRGSDQLLAAAERKGDERVLLEIRADDLIAKEIKYHKGCYNSYTRERQNTDVNSTVEGKGYDRAFKRLADYVSQSIITELDVVKMTDLREMYITILDECDIDAPDYRTEKLKSKLVTHFGDSIAFWKPQRRTETEFVYSTCVSTGQAIEAGAAAAGIEVPTMPVVGHSDDAIKEVYRCAQLMRTELLAVKNTMPWPPKAEDLAEHKVNVPDLLYNFLGWVLDGDSDDGVVSIERCKLSEKSNRHVLSVSQDLLHCISGGRIKTPKHVILPLTVKHLTHSTQLVTFLNRFGHGLSNSQIQEVETAMAEMHIEQVVHGAIYIPPNIQPNSPVMMCWDNNDLNEETLSGSGTTHCTNGIVIQNYVHDVQPIASGSAVRQKRKRKRAFTPQPSNILQYNAGSRHGPSAIPITEQDLMSLETRQTPHCIADADKKDMAWCLIRSSSDVNTQDMPQRVPGWTGFNAALCTNIPSPSTVGYCPVIDASPTELSTVYTLLKRSVDMGRKLGQDELILVMDLAVYAKAQEIVWKQQEEFSHVVLRMGGFHTSMTFLAVLGKRFGDAGLSDLLVEADVVAAGSLPGVMEGRHYNRAMRAHKTVMEGMQRLRLLSFKEWMISTGHEDELMTKDDLESVCSHLSSDTVTTLIASTKFKRLVELFGKFCETDRGPLARLWDSYIDLVCLLLRFTRATREGNWELHIASIHQMLPWMFAYDRTNYARYLSAYWCEMVKLPETHPESNRLLQGGFFAVQRSRGSAFAQVAVDQTIEQTMNRDSKSSGGIVGISLNRGAVQRWILTVHDRAMILQLCKGMAGLPDAGGHSRKDASGPRILKDERDVQKVMETIDSWVNPFSTRETADPLINIASGVTATEEISVDLLTAAQKGQHAFTNFVKNRIQSSEVDFFAPLPKSSLKSFGNLVKSKTTKLASTDVVIKADRGLFAKMVVIAQRRHMDMQDVLKYPLGPLPWSLATPDGAPAKTAKATLLHLIEGEIDPVEDVPVSAVLIIDGMEIMHSIKTIPKTFSELAKYVFQLVKTYSYNRDRIDFVMDQYPDVSIKNPEHTKRATGGSLQVKIHGGNQKCPSQWKKFLSNGSNKMNLAHFLAKEWQEPSYATMYEGLGPLYVTHGEECHQLVVTENVITSTRIDLLCTKQEEADTRILLHASHAASQGHECIIIRSPDTDVAVLACAFSHTIAARLLFCTGTKQRLRYIDATAIGISLGVDVCQALPGMHAFTGCDSTSAFVGKGKKQAFHLVKSDQDMCNAMKAVGTSFDVSDEQLDGCERFVCALYGYKDADINTVRYKLFCSKNAQTCHLPPTKDAIKHHVARVNYQTCIWKSSLQCDAAVPSPDGHGWDVADNNISIHWTDQQPAPKAILELISCKCKKNQCVGSRCSCRKNAMPCTDVCGCMDCTNSQNTDTNDVDSSDDSSGSGDED